MDEYGVKIINATGNIQIDSNFRNLYLVSKVEVTVGAAPANGNNVARGTVSTPSGYSNCIVALCPKVFNTNARFVLNKWLAADTYEIWSTVGNIVYEVFFFSLGNNSLGEYGLIINNAQGELVYNSNNQYMRVVDYQCRPDIVGIMDDNDKVFYEKEYPTGSKYAVAYVEPAKAEEIFYYQLPGEGGDWSYHGWFWQHSALVNFTAANKLRVINTTTGYENIVDSSDRSYTQFSNHLNMMVLDVTNY